MEIDENMVELVEAINDIRGLSTFSSCGGHDSPKAGQVEAGRFTVSFSADLGDAGWRGLTLLSCAVREYIGEIDADVVCLQAWFNGHDSDDADDPEFLCFDLTGEAPAVPQQLAEVIAEILVQIE
jgi:hypothetical protein